MAAVAGKYLIKHEIAGPAAGRQEHVEEGGYRVKAGLAPRWQAEGGKPPPKLLDCSGLPKTYASKGGGAVKESKELKAHRKKLLQAFTLKQPRNGGT
jgi:hypothetical protein